ncbi:hypothetical protein [Labilibaculum euxinus]
MSNRSVFLSVLELSKGDKKKKGTITRRIFQLEQRTLCLKNTSKEVLEIYSQKELKKREYFLLLIEIYSIADNRIGVKDENIMNLINDFNFYRLPSDDGILMLGDYVRKNQLLKKDELSKYFDSSLCRYFDCLRIDFKDLLFSCNWLKKSRNRYCRKVQNLRRALEKDYRRYLRDGKIIIDEE